MSPAAGPVTCLLRRIRLAAPGHVARASGVLWTGRGMDVQGGRCGVFGTRAPTIRVGWPDNRYAGPAASVRFRAGTVRSPTDSGPAVPACFLRGGRPITGKTLPTQPRRQRLRRNAGVGPGTSRRAANRRRRARGDGNVSPSPPGPSRVSPGGNGGWRVPHSADRSLRPQGLADGPRARVKIYRCMGGQTHPSQTRPRLCPWTRHHTIEPGGTIMV